MNGLRAAGLGRVASAIALAASQAHLGCAGAFPTPASTTTAEVIPPELQREAERARLIGLAIYEQDVASAMATDVLLAAGILPGDGSIRGWVTMPRGEGSLVLFVSQRDGVPSVTHEVALDPGESPLLKKVEPPRALEGEALARYRSRTTALSARFEACSRTYNPVVLPASGLGKEGWLVYLLAATTDPGVIVQGGHHRFVISPDGTRVLEQMAMSIGCRAGRPPADAVGLALTTPIADHPLETHVFISMQYGLLYGIATARNGRVWTLDGRALRAELERTPKSTLPR